MSSVADPTDYLSEYSADYPEADPASPSFDDDDTTPAQTMSRKALEEIARAFEGVDMASMPVIPTSAPCRLPDANPNDWHPPFGKHASADLIGLDQLGVIDEVAAWLCEGCPVLQACGDWALDNPKQEGILGGMTDKRRKEIRRGLRAGHDRQVG